MSICGAEDHQIHWTSCVGYKHLRDGLDLDGSDLELVRYYQLITKEREQEEERGQGEGGKGGKKTEITRTNRKHYMQSWLEKQDHDCRRI